MMRIGDVAKKTGLTVKTLRFYEEQDLLGEVPRRGRYRSYGASHLERLELICHSKRLGLTLAEIRRVLLSRDGADASAIALGIVEAKMEARRQEIAAAQRSLESLDEARRQILRCLGR